MEINRNKQVKKKEFTELNHSIFYTSLWTNEQMVVFFRQRTKEQKGCALKIISAAY